jgi:glycosyltransferase involved in cell wall biosynthesis
MVVLNEAANIRFSLGSLLPWCDEVIVVDQHSEDGTAAIAREMGATVLEQERTGFVEPARQYGVDHATADWIMILDGDEVVHPGLARHLRDLADRDEPVDAVFLPNVNIMLGRWVRYGKWWPGRKVRFFRRGGLELSGRIHAGIRPVRGARRLLLPARKDLAVWHFSYHSLTDMVEKANRYSSVEARQRAERRRRARTRPRPRPRAALVAAARRLWREYIRGGGYRDGIAGLAIGVTRAYYSFLETAKEWDEPRIAERLAAYDRVRSTLLAGFGPGPAEGASEPARPEDHAEGGRPPS